MNGLSEEIFQSDYEADFQGEYLDMVAGDYEAGDYEADYEGEGEWGYEEEGEADFEGEGEGPFSEEQEIEMAAELLSLSQEGEVDQFLGKLLRRAGQAVGTFLPPGAGQALKGLLGQAAKKVLPIAGRAIGGYFGGPAGAAIGTKIADAGSQIFGLEMEGMSGEDQELQVAQRFVRLAGDAATKAAEVASGAPPEQTARAALAAAARQHAPGLLRNGGAAPGGYMGAGYGGWRGRSGRWIRRGNKIVLLGV